jgi:hypothetical protein
MLPQVRKRRELSPREDDSVVLHLAEEERIDRLLLGQPPQVVDEAWNANGSVPVSSAARETSSCTRFSARRGSRTTTNRSTSESSRVRSSRAREP